MLQLKNISKTYRTKSGATHRALNNVSLRFGEKGLVFIVGRSGGGKSTLLNMIAALDKPDSGEMLLYGNSFSAFTKSDYDSYRNTFIGVIFQEYNLLKTLTVRENISLALGLQHNESDEKVEAVIKKLGLDELAERKPNDISGGQSQRVAIARAVVKDPKIIVADEPTGNLDSKTGHEMFEIFKELSKDRLVIIVTHDRDIADEMGDRVIEILDGRVHKDVVRTSEPYESAVDVVGDRLIRVPKGKKLDERSLGEINRIIGLSDKDTYIINEHDTQKVKSMNLHVKNAVEIEQHDTSVYYYPYRAEPVEARQISMIKSKMPLKTGLKLSLSMLKYKKFRLVITVLMTVISLLLSAVIASFQSYHVSRSVTKTIVKDKIGFGAVTKTAEYLSDTVFTDEDVNDISAYTDTAVKVHTGQFLPVIENKDGRTPTEAEKKTSPFAESHNGLTEVPALFESFYGIAETGSPETLGLQLKYGKMPEDYNGVVISETAATYFCDKLLYYPVTEISGLIGKKIIVCDREMTITGIISSDMERYERIVQICINSGVNLFNQFFDVSGGILTDYLYDLENKDGLLYVKPGFVEEFAKTGHALGYLTFTDGIRESVDVMIRSKNASPTVVREFESGKGGIYIDRAVYRALFGDDTFMTETVEKFNEGGYSTSLTHKNAFKVYGTLTSAVYGKTKIAAVVEGIDQSIYVDEKDCRKFMEDEISPRKLIVKFGQNERSVSALISALDGKNASVYAPFVSEYDDFASKLKTASEHLTRLLILMAAVSALLLYLFISATVKIEGRNIGILRGMGARGVDTFKAFGIEGLIITVISLVITVILLFIFFPVLNAMVSADYAFSFFAFVLTPYVIPALIITSLLITAVAVTVPLLRLVSLMPVDTMNKNENQR